VIRLSWQDDAIAAEDFMWGFEQDGDIIGRPVDIVGDGAGGYFVSDDYARVVYRLSPHRGLRSAQTYTGERAGDEADHWQLDSGLAEQGRELYQSLHCDECHGAAALTPVPLVHLSRRYNPEKLAAYFLTPTPPMPRLELSLLQRQQLAHHLLTLDQSATAK
jgi:hypothetical protein